MRVRLKFVWQDMWVGGYWDGDKRRLYVCVVPCLPLVFSWPVPCPSCNGTGQVPWTPPPGMSVTVRHAICNGTGKVYR